MHHLSHTAPVAAASALPESLAAGAEDATPDRLPWGSAALVLTGLCLLLWGAVIAAVAAIV